LHRFAREIIAPLVEPQGYHVQTPDAPEMGHIMDQVVGALDRAELVVADLTGNNPNVLYELAIRHCLGGAYIVVREDSDTAKLDRTAFDVSAFRFTEISFVDVAMARTALRRVIQNTCEKIQAKQSIANPVTNCFGMPLCELSPSAGLALGYYQNFVKPTVRCLKDPQCRVRIGEVDAATAPASGLTLDIIIPDRLVQATHTYARDVLLAGRILDPAMLGEAPPGTRLYAWPPDSGRRGLVDIPTTMTVMEASIRARLNDPAAGRNSPLWRWLETQEINRFRSALDRLIQNEADEPLLSTRVQLLEGRVLEPS
jgi:hypothetical protein